MANSPIKVGIFVLAMVLVLACTPPPAPTPTALPTPTATPAPTPTPTTIPTATPAPTPTAIPPAWEFLEVGPDAITGIGGVFLDSVGEMEGVDPSASLYRPPVLSLGCYEDDFSVTVNWGGRYLADHLSTDRVAVVYKVDENEPKVATARASADNEDAYLFRSQADILARRLLDSTTAVVRVTNFDDTEMTARFTVTGLREMKPLLECW